MEAVVQRLTQLSDCIVFGVNVFGCEGKAGMAVISGHTSQLDITRLAQHLMEQLPAYAVPLFVRLTQRIEVTGTYKLLKNEFVTTGYSPHLTNDQMFYLDNKLKIYIPMDERVYQQIETGAIKF